MVGEVKKLPRALDASLARMSGPPFTDRGRSGILGISSIGDPLGERNNTISHGKGLEMPDLMIDVEGLVKAYGRDKLVLDGVSFSVAIGEFMVVHGSSGCGKTTLLNILGGLDRPTSGRVTIDGIGLSGLSEDELANMRLNTLGFVFQDFNLLLDLTVRENIALPLKFSGGRDHGRVDELLDQFEISEIADEKANRISGGEAQRAAIARAMANRPKMLLADEPTGNLDKENARNVIRLFEKASRELNVTVILATHDPELVLSAQSRMHLCRGKAILSPPRP